MLVPAPLAAEPARRSWRSVVRSIALAPVRFYRRFLSPLKRAPTCRFLPTCSEYAIEAIERKGVLVGGMQAAWRLCRCNPLFRGGYDPVEAGRCSREGL